MAIVTFGTTSRANTAFGVKNASGKNLVIALLRNTVISPNETHFYTFNTFDARVRTNHRFEDVYTVNSNGTSYLDDVAEFAKNVVNGNLVVMTTTQPLTSTTYVAGTSAAFTATGDGSVTFA